MATRPILHEAVAGQKSKASDYNSNFSLMLDYIDDAIEENEDYTQAQLTTYANINTLATEGTIALTDNTVNAITPTGAVTFTLPSITSSGAGKFHQILVQVNLSTVYTINLGTTYCFDLNFPTLSIEGMYDVIYEYDNATDNWVCGAIFKGEVS